MKKMIVAVLVAIFLFYGKSFATTIIFDNTKEETAGNADWVIGNSPNWIGGFSDYGQALRDLGYVTSTLNGSQITSYSLQNCDVFIIPEPQNPFSNSEKQAILNFVQNGGGLFMIADHDGADRNNNGWDAQDIFDNSLYAMTNFHMSFNSDNEWLEPSNYIEYPRTFITENVNQVGYWAGSTMSSNSPAVEHIWKEYSHYHALLVTCDYGEGRVAGWGDSATFDDGTGNSGNNLYDGWSVYDDTQLAINVVRWLLHEDVGINDNEIENGEMIKVKSNPSFGKVSFSIVAKNSKIAKISIYNIKGQKIKTYVIGNSAFYFGKGDSSVVWDGKDEFGKPVDSGIYFYNCKSGNINGAFKKFVLLSSGSR